VIKRAASLIASLQILLVLSSSFLFAHAAAEVDIIAVDHPSEVAPNMSFEVTVTVRYSLDDASRYVVWVRIYDYDAGSVIVESKREGMIVNVGLKTYTLSLTSPPVEKEWRLGAQVLHWLRGDPGLAHQSEMKDFIVTVRQTPQKYSTSLGAIDDAYVSSLYPYINRGSDNQLLLANYRSRDVDVKILVYIKFDLANIPSNLEIISAKLELYSKSVTIPSQISMYHCPYNSWNERDITYANAPEYDPTSTSSSYVSGANAWYSWDLTSDVRNARGGQLSEVLQISFSSEPNHVSFYSKESSDSSYRPRLTVNHGKLVGASLITCHVAAKTIQIGEKLEITGAISPPHGGVPVSITYKSSEGPPFTRTVVTSSDGTFSDSFIPQTSGEWTVSTSWAGDEDHYGSTSETTSFVVQEKPQITPIPPPPTIGFPIFWISVLITIALCIFVIATFLYLTRSRRAAPPFSRRRVKPITPPPPRLPKTPPEMPEVTPAPTERKLPEVKTVPVEALMPLDEKVYLYIVDHGGEISWSQASREIGVSIEELKACVERLKQAKRIE
jgi:hypothetical protein